MSWPTGPRLQPCHLLTVAPTLCFERMGHLRSGVLIRQHLPNTTCGQGFDPLTLYDLAITLLPFG